MSPWASLYRQHEEMRPRHARLVEDLKGPLRRLSDLKIYCDHSLPWFLRTSSEAEGVIIVFTQAHNAAPGPVPLKNLPDLAEARLSIQATLDKVSGRAHEFSAAVSGKTPKGVDWTVAVHLETDRREPAKSGWQSDWRGGGACTHAVLHCHVGPDLDALPKVRVPLPAVGAPAALDWLLATVVPGLEPMPWATLHDLLATTKN